MGSRLADATNSWRALIAVLVTTTALAIACGPASAGGGATPTRETAPAPIDHVEVTVHGSGTREATLKVTAGLPSGCAQQDSHSVSRSGNTFTVTVLNSMPTGNAACTMIYGHYELTVDLPGPFVPGTTYTVRVNDKATTFTI